MQVIKQYHSDKLNSSQHIELYWDIFNMCNYNCSYCFMRPTSAWNKISNWQQQKLLISQLANTEVNVNIDLIGGEPTMHPKYVEFISLLHDALYDSSTGILKGKITTVTNNTNNKLLQVSSDISKNLELILSFHCEEANVDDFLRNIDLLQNHRYKSIFVSIMLHFNVNYKEKIQSLVNKLIEKNILFDFTYIVINNSLAKVNEQYYRYFLNQTKLEKKYVFEYSNDQIEYLSNLELKQAIADNKTVFKGWNCQLNAFYIDIHNTISRRCIGGTYMMSDIIKKTFNQQVTCPKERCIHDCFLGFIKEK